MARTLAAWIKEHTKAVAFVISFMLVFIFLSIANVQEMLYDSGSYQELAKTFGNSGTFRLSTFPATIRGIVFPLFLYCFNCIAGTITTNPMMGWRLLISSMTALVTVLLPTIFLNLQKKKRGLWWYLLFPVLLIFFWYGLLNYILSDLVAIYFLIIGFCLLFSVFRERSTFRIKSAAFSLVAGASLYAAYNTRTIYLFSLMVFIPCFFIYQWMSDSPNRKRTVFSFLFFMVGFLALSSMQIYSNHLHHGIWSFLVQTKYYLADNLFDFQISHGLWMTQYETHIGPSEQYPPGGLIFLDHAGLRVFGQNSTIWEAFLHPFDAIGVYWRHFISMLNPVWGGGAYINDLHALKIHRSIINYGLLFFVGVQCIHWVGATPFRNLVEKSKAHINTLLCLLAIGIACIAILPGAVEQRFFVPVYIVIYGIVAFCIDYGKMWRKIKQRPFIYAFAFVMLFLLLCGQWASTYALTAADIVLSIM